jgi:hypothetical protein
VPQLDIQLIIQQLLQSLSTLRLTQSTTMSSPVPDVPLVPGGLFHVSPDTVIVEDADEEVRAIAISRTSSSRPTNS